MDDDEVIDYAANLLVERFSRVPLKRLNPLMSKEQTVPYYLVINPYTGIVVDEVWRDERGNMHREGWPAYVSRDDKTGVSLREAWYKHNLPHREGGPSFTERKKTGLVLQQEWWENGKPLRVEVRNNGKMCSVPLRHAMQANPMI